MQTWFCHAFTPFAFTFFVYFFHSSALPLRCFLFLPQSSSCWRESSERRKRESRERVERGKVGWWNVELTFFRVKYLALWAENPKGSVKQQERRKTIFALTRTQMTVGTEMWKQKCKDTKQVEQQQNRTDDYNCIFKVVFWFVCDLFFGAGFSDFEHGKHTLRHIEAADDLRKFNTTKNRQKKIQQEYRPTCQMKNIRWLTQREDPSIPTTAKLRSAHHSKRPRSWHQWQWHLATRRGNGRWINQVRWDVQAENGKYPKWH